jgi:TonB family protein
VVPPGEEVYDVGAVDRVPELRNRRDVERLAARSYPPHLRDAGVSADVIVSLIVNRDGRVDASSIQVLNDVNPAFADAARQVAQRMRFRPAQLRGDEVRTVVQLPIRFNAR